MARSTVHLSASAGRCGGFSGWSAWFPQTKKRKTDHHDSFCLPYTAPFKAVSNILSKQHATGSHPNNIPIGIYYQSYLYVYICFGKKEGPDQHSRFHVNTLWSGPKDEACLLPCCASLLPFSESVYCLNSLNSQERKLRPGRRGIRSPCYRFRRWSATWWDRESYLPP